jgi:predicted site-specific integrase-resolvase
MQTASLDTGGTVDDESLSLIDRIQAAERLRVSERTVRRYGKAGLLDERRIGPKLVRVTEQSVNKLLRSGMDSAA